MSSAEDIKWLTEAKGVPWKIAAQAYADAERAAKKRRPKGFDALLMAEKEGAPSIREDALKLLDEPARQPAAVEALARIRKESKMPLAACRLALAEGNYDADAALAILLRQKGGKGDEKPPAKRPSANAKRLAELKKKRAAALKGPKVNHHLMGVSGTRSSSCVLLAARVRPLTKEEKRAHADDRRRDADVCIVYATDAGWKRRRVAGHYDDLWVRADRQLTVLRGGVICSIADLGGEGSEELEPGSGIPRRITGRDGAGELAYDPLARAEASMWWRPEGRAWAELPRPPGNMTLDAQVTDSGTWVCGGQVVARFDGERWEQVDVVFKSADPGRGWFTRMCVSPEGEVLAVRGGSIFAGDSARIAEVVYEGLHDITSICHFRGQFWIGHARKGICRWDGEKLVAVRPMKKQTAIAETEPVYVSARDTLLALSRAELVESVDGVDFATVATSAQIADVAGSADVYWNKPEAPSSLPG